MDNKSTFQELFNKDYKNGKSNEERVVKFLNDNTYYQYYLEKKKFSLYDFKIFNEPNRLEELKSRDFFHDDFETAMIGKEKIEKAIKYHKKMKFQFWYLYKDGLFY